MNKWGERGLPCLRSFLMHNHFPSDLLMLIIEVEYFVKLDSQEMYVNLKPLFSSRVIKKSHDIESKAFLKSIFSSIPGVFDLQKQLMISEAIAQLSKIILPLKAIYEGAINELMTFLSPMESALDMSLMIPCSKQMGL